jgi:hypothetical protein
MSKINNFDVLKAMSDDNSPNLQLAPLGNVLGMQKDSHGTRITIGVGMPGVIEKLMRNELVGGLILADKAEFDRVKAELEAKQVEGTVAG